MRRLSPLLIVLLIGASARAAGVSLTVQLPANVQVKSATAVAPSMRLDTSASVTQNAVAFHNLLPDTSYDLTLRLTDGAVLQGVDLGWYTPEPAKPDAGPLSDDDRKEIATIVNGLEPFMNKNQILFLRGNHDRASALIQFVRDKGFVNDRGGEVIWRVELWYFQYQAGGWEAVNQVNKILRRERFKSPDAYRATVGKLTWVPALGGIKVSADHSPLTIPLPPIEKN